MNLGKWQNPAYRLVTVILMRCGLRITDATAIPAGCVIRHAAGAPYLRYYNHKMKREALVPVDEELAALAAAQEARNRQRWPQGTPVLFPRPDANIDGTRPVRGDTYRRVMMVLGRDTASDNPTLASFYTQSSFKIVPMPRFLVNSELLLLPNRSR